MTCIILFLLIINVRLYSWPLRTVHNLVRQHIWGEVVVLIPFFPKILSEFNSEKRIWKLVHVCRSYHKNKSVRIFETRGISAAFSTISHDILIERLEFGVRDPALSWLCWYLSCHVRRGLSTLYIYKLNGLLLNSAGTLSLSQHQQPGTHLVISLLNKASCLMRIC